VILLGESVPDLRPVPRRGREAVYEYDSFVRVSVFLDVEYSDVIVVILVLMDVVATCVVPVVGRGFGHVQAWATIILNSIHESRLDYTAKCRMYVYRVGHFVRRCDVVGDSVVITIVFLR
jgi:hypothetical protein